MNHRATKLSRTGPLDPGCDPGQQSVDRLTTAASFLAQEFSKNAGSNWAAWIIDFLQILEKQAVAMEAAPDFFEQVLVHVDNHLHHRLNSGKWL